MMFLYLLPPARPTLIQATRANANIEEFLLAGAGSSRRHKFNARARVAVLLGGLRLMGALYN